MRLSVENLEVRYGDLIGVADVSLEIPQAQSSRSSGPMAPARQPHSTPSPA